MLEKYQDEVLETYQRKKKKNELTTHLLYPTAANLRHECALIFHKRPNDNIKSILQAFGPIGFQIKNADDILSIDPDKFRPLLKFMKGEIFSASAHNVKLLAWLINFEQTDKTGQNPSTTVSGVIKWILTYFKGAKVVIIISLLIVAIGAGAFIIINKNQCMYWKEDHYESIGCKVQIDEATVIALDQQRADRLRRITRLDTIGEKDLGKTWYVKIKVDSAEFYTDSGEYPMDTRKRLLPMTPYILDKYILKKEQSVESR